MSFRVGNLLMVLVFLVSAVLQYNDPDPYRWMFIYGAAAVLSGAATRSGGGWLLPAILGATSVLGALYLAARLICRQPIFGSEEGREMLGLGLVAVWMGVLVIRRRRSSAERDS